MKLKSNAPADFVSLYKQEMALREGAKVIKTYQFSDMVDATVTAAEVVVDIKTKDGKEFTVKQMSMTFADGTVDFWDIYTRDPLAEGDLVDPKSLKFQKRLLATGKTKLYITGTAL